VPATCSLPCGKGTAVVQRSVFLGMEQRIASELDTTVRCVASGVLLLLLGAGRRLSSCECLSLYTSLYLSVSLSTTPRSLSITYATTVESLHGTLAAAVDPNGQFNNIPQAVVIFAPLPPAPSRSLPHLSLSSLSVCLGVCVCMVLVCGVSVLHCHRTTTHKQAYSFSQTHTHPSTLSW